jgi:signal transduction histidine kinase
MNVVHVPALERTGALRLAQADESAASPDAESIDSWLGTLVELLLGVTRSVEVAVFEYRRASGRLVPGRCVSKPNEKPSPVFLPRVLTDRDSASGPSACFPIRTRDGAGEPNLIAFRFSDGDEPLAGGYAIFHGTPTNEEWRAMQAICRLGGSLIVAHRKTLMQRHTEASTHAFGGRMLDGLRTGLDAYWEADAAGTITKVVRLSSADEVLFRALEGTNLRAVLPKTASATGEFHNVRLEVGPATLVMSGRILADGASVGAARKRARENADEMSNQVARSLMEKIEAARDDEAALRRETELILDGLRILTSPKASREVFDALLALLAPALEFKAAVILQRDWSGQIAPSVATNPLLMELDWQNTGTALFAAEEGTTIYRIPDELGLPELPPGVGGPFASSLAIGLRGGSKQTVLLCLHTQSNFFTARHRGLGTRLSLIASQAYMNKEERQKVVDSSKLATIGEMAAGIVHEINQPLTVMTLGINNMLEMIELDSGLDPEKLKAKLNRLQGQIERVSKIVASMRVLTRTSDGVTEPFSLAEAITEATGIIQHKLTKAQITLDVAADPELQAHGNRLEFSQVILNLLTNGHDAIQSRISKSEGAAGPMSISVAARADGEEWLDVTVRDTGSGFPKKDAERAFEPFFTTKGVGKGTGLGLALCRRIVENMGGTIALGNWDKGAEIRIRLKRATAENSPRT